MVKKHRMVCYLLVVCIIYHKTNYIIIGPSTAKNLLTIERDLSREHDIRAISTKAILSHTYILFLSFASGLIDPHS